MSAFSKNNIKIRNCTKVLIFFTKYDWNIDLKNVQELNFGTKRPNNGHVNKDKIKKNTLYMLPLVMIYLDSKK